MKKFFKIDILLVAIVMLFASSCTTDKVVDLCERDYGYVQFKLYKEASYEPTKATRADYDPFDIYLAEACKIEVNLTDVNNRPIRQTLVLSAANATTAEYGLRSDKLKLLTGEYKLGTVLLFDAEDEVLARFVPNSKREFSVVAGGLTIHDVTVDVTQRGQVQFTLVKDFSGFENIPTRGERPTEYCFDEIKYVDIAIKKVRNGATIGEPIVLEALPCKFSQHFDEEDYQSDKHGYKTSSILCDTVLLLEADTYRVVSYTTKSNKSTGILEVNDKPAITEFSIEDNKLTESKVKVALYESDEYIKDNYALYWIWKSLDGDNWSYDGESYPRGTNWNFDKDVELWCKPRFEQLRL